MKHTIFIDILLLIGVVYLFSCCGGNRTPCSNNSETDGNYNINYYVDTINGHVILSTVVNSKYDNNVSISTLELK